MNPSDQARQIGTVDSWLSQATAWNDTTNPGAATVLADIGALAAGYYDLYFTACWSAALGFVNLLIEHRNAANTAQLWANVIVDPAAGAKMWSYKNFKIAPNERWRFYCETAFTGRIGTGILAIRRA